MSYRRCDKATGIGSVGLIFDIESLDHVLLLRKSHPDWLAGKLVGPGGTVERGEGPLDAAHREMREEAGLQPGDFTLFARLHRTTPTHPYLITHFYRATLPFHILYQAAHDPVNKLRDEPLVLLPVSRMGQDDVCPNERYLAQVARSIIWGQLEVSFLDIYEEYKPAHERFGGGY